MSPRDTERSAAHARCTEKDPKPIRSGGAAPVTRTPHGTRKARHSCRKLKGATHSGSATSGTVRVHPSPAYYAMCFVVEGPTRASRRGGPFSVEAPTSRRSTSTATSGGFLSVEGLNATRSNVKDPSTSRRINAEDLSTPRTSQRRGGVNVDEGQRRERALIVEGRLNVDGKVNVEKEPSSSRGASTSTGRSTSSFGDEMINVDDK